MSNVAMIRSSLISAVVAQVAKTGTDPGPLLRKYGFSGATLSNPYALVPLHRFVALCEDAALVTGDDAIGLRVGQAISSGHQGPAGFIFSASKTVGEALRRYAQLMAAWQDSAHTGVVGFGNGAEAYIYRITDERIRLRRQDAELTLSTVHQQLKSVLGRNWRPLGVHFEHAMPADIRPHRKIFDAPLSFGEPINCLLVAESDLQKTLSSQDDSLWPFIERHLTDLSKERQSVLSFREQVDNAIVNRLGFGGVGIGSISADLGLSMRTLQRRLKEEDLTFGALLHAARRRIAETSLSKPRSRVVDVANALGYADTAVLSRAFKRWTGTSPRQFAKDGKNRAQLSDGSVDQS
ncbi:AraC family transcriptional regulator [Mesorhizobium koreense]|uniref:AraC family transcriptional regulator n=1 Tax=Mesorhizobium koreense TaxID=3074855 RepID=UPI00287B5C5E|nr:AraC family transcriptional regulator [Mesorhizobium sp. WR6]